MTTGEPDGRGIVRSPLDPGGQSTHNALSLIHNRSQPGFPMTELRIFPMSMNDYPEAMALWQ